MCNIIYFFMSQTPPKRSAQSLSFSGDPMILLLSHCAFRFRRMGRIKKGRSAHICECLAECLMCLPVLYLMCLGAVVHCPTLRAPTKFRGIHKLATIEEIPIFKLSPLGRNDMHFGADATGVRHVFGHMTLGRHGVFVVTTGFSAQAPRNVCNQTFN